MSNQISTTIIMCIIFGLFSFYYFNKFQESELEYVKLHKRFDEIHIENQKMKSRIKDLQSYKNDVSKTMQILDNELMVINNHIQKQNSESTLQEDMSSTSPIGRRSPYLRSNLRSNTSRNNISLLSPELLSTLFNNMNQEVYQTPSQQVPYGLASETIDVQNNLQSNTLPSNDGGGRDTNQHTTRSSSVDIQNELNKEDVTLDENVININYDITYNPNQSNYEQFLINKQM